MISALRPLPSRRASRSVAALALSIAGFGCDRRGDGVPDGPALPEVPMVPQINPATPAAEPPDNPARLADGRDETSVPVPETTAAEQREAKATFKTAPGYELSGVAELVEGATGVKFVINIENAPPGKKGIHVHEKGNCSDIAGNSMGEHFGPNAEGHGLPPNTARHLGDLGNLDVKKNGKATLEIEARNANLKPKDPMSFLGRALVIHAGEDKGTQPSGGAGAPIACAVIVAD